MAVCYYVTMPDYAKRIAELTAILGETEEGAARLRKELGTKVVRLKKTERPDGTEELFEEYKRLTQIIDSAGTDIERMSTIDTRQTEIQTEMKELRAEHEKLDKGLEPVFHQIGGVAFRLFREHPLVDTGYSSAFASLARYYDQVRAIDKELEQIGAGDDGGSRKILEKVSLRSREFILRNRKTVKENQLPRLLTNAGHELAATDFINAMDDGELNRVSEPLREVRERQTEIEQQLEALREESGQLVAEFNTVAEGRKLAPARKQRETQIENAKDQLNTVLVSLGTTAESAELPSLSTEIEEIRAEESRVAHFTTLIVRLEAGRESIRVQKSIDALVARREKAQQQIADLESHVESLQKEQAERKAELAQLSKERGDERELFES